MLSLPQKPIESQAASVQPQTSTLQPAQSNQMMSISKYLEQHPQLEEEVKGMFRTKYEELTGKLPMPQIEEYILTIGIKCDSSREMIVENFQVLFKDLTDPIVKYLFETVAPRITQMALNLQKESNLFEDQHSSGQPLLLQPSQQNKQG